MPEAENGRNEPRISVLRRIIFWLFISVSILFFGIYFLLQIPAVQNWAAGKITAFLSRELDTEVQLGFVSLEFFDKVVLRELYIEDQGGDTLLFAERLRVDLNFSAWDLFQKKLSIQDINLQHARLYIRRDKGEAANNLAFITEYLKGDPDKKPGRKPFQLRLETMLLQDVELATIDSVKGQTLRIGLAEGNIDLRELDLVLRRVQANRIFLDQPRIGIWSYPGDSTGLAMPDSAALAELPDSMAIFPGWLFCIDAFDLADGQFELHNLRKEPVQISAQDILDYNHMEVFEIAIHVRDLNFSDGLFEGDLQEISFCDKSGFTLKELSAKEAKVSSRGITLNDMRLVTPFSEIGDTLVLTYKRYPDFIEFPDRVKMDARFHGARVAMEDILVFAPALENNLFFSGNRQEVAFIDGQLTGKVNSLRGKDLDIRLGRSTRIQGNFTALNLAVPDLQSLNLRLDRLQTDMTTVRALIPNFNLPETFDKLGRLDFRGSFDGFFTDFVAYGDLRTQLGRAILDMRMNNLSAGREKAQYSGDLSLIAFDLQTWTGSSQFGDITFVSKVKDGVGLTSASANATLEARIDSFSFRNYNYQNIQMRGQLNKNLFDGSLEIRDDNIDLVFSGDIDFTQAVPNINFRADINKLDMRPLNLTKENYSLSAQVRFDFTDIDLSKVEGYARIDNLTLLNPERERFELDSFLVNAQNTPEGKILLVESELTELSARGQFNLDEVPEALLQVLRRNFPAFSEKFKLLPKGTAVAPHLLDFDLKIHDTQNWLSLLSPQLGPIQKARLTGHFNNQTDSIKADLELPQLALGEVRFNDIVLVANSLRDTCTIDIGVFQTLIGQNQELAPINLLGILGGDTLSFGITAYNFTDVLNNLELDAQLFLAESDYLVRFLESDLVIWNEIWQVKENNFLRFGKDFVATRNFVLSNGDRSIVLETLGKKGLFLSLNNFKMDLLNPMLDYDPVQFRGPVNIEAQVEDVFALQGLSLRATADTLGINSDDWGALDLEISADDLKSRAQSRISLKRPGKRILARATLNLPGYKPQSNEDKEQPLYFDASLAANNYPLSILEYWIGAGVSNTVGEFDANVRVFGKPNLPFISGKAAIRNAATTIDFLKTRYFIESHELQIDSRLIDATGAIVRDELGNKATVYGGITHDHLKNLGLDARISADNFLLLDTKKGDYSVFYGKAIAKCDIRFTGSFAKTDIYVSATSRSGTHVVLPISSERSASEVNYIHFVERRTTEPEESLETAAADQVGIALTMDLNITEDATVEIVFNEQAGDILRGVGKGTLQLLVPRSGDFLMYGEYVVSEGEYLFTLLNLVNKPFVVRRNGSVRWAGDPFAAQINIEAQYKGLQASVSNFIAEYLVSAPEATKQAARLATDVDLVMILTGNLLNPSIAFDIQFPKLLGELKNYADSKLRVIQQDQNEMNRQVFGLIVIGQFLPSDAGLQGQEFQIGINTLTEMLSQQLSLYLTSLVSEWLTEDGLISGIDFDIGYNYFQGADPLNDDPNQLYRGNEVQVRLKNYLFDDRLSVNVGGNIELAGNNYVGTTPNSGVFFTGDLTVEYILSKDRGLKIRFYQSTEPEIGGGRRNKTGLGLSYRKEFDSFGEFLRGLKRAAKKIGNS